MFTCVNRTKDTAAEIPRGVQNASLMVQRITAVFRTKRQFTAFKLICILFSLLAFRTGKELHCHPELQRSTVWMYKFWQNAEKLMKKNYARKKNSRSAKIIVLPKNRQRGRRSLFRRCKTSNSETYRIFVIQKRSEPEVVTICQLPHQ